MMVIKFKKTQFAISLFVLHLSSCDMMPTIAAEMNQIEEKCEIVASPALTNKHKIDKGHEEIVHYRLFLEPSKRRYVSACGVHVSPKVGRFLEAQGGQTNSVERDAYIAINKNEKSVEFYLLCYVNGLSQAGNDIGWQKRMILSREDQKTDCTISSDQNAEPEILGARDKEGRLEIEKN